VRVPWGLTSLLVLMPLFYFIAEPSVPSDLPEVTDVPASTPVSPVSSDETIGCMTVVDYLTCLFCYKCHCATLFRALCTAAGF
jgi:hypothetical protein